MGGFSYNTARKALAVLSQRNQCRIIPGKGILAEPVPASIRGPADGADSRPPEPEKVWQRLVGQLSADICAGTYRSGDALPSRKELAARYGVCYTTLKRALATLVEKGLLVPRGIRYRVFSITPSQTPTTATVVAVNVFNRLSLFAGRDGRSAELWRTIERLSVRHNFRIKYVSVHHGNPPGTDVRGLLEIGTGLPLLGYLVTTRGMGVENVSLVARLLAAQGTPVAVFNDTFPADTLPEPMRTSRIFRSFTVAITEDCGRAVGDYLLSRGHRKVCFFAEPQESDPLSQPYYSARRYEGISSVLAASGEVNLNVLKAAVPSGAAMYLPEVLSRMDQRHRDILPLLERISRQVPPGERSSGLFEIDNSLRNVLWPAMVERENERRLEELLADRTYTAWVAASDLIALALLSFLQKRAIRVPEDLSLIGFDDSISAFNCDLTSYNFNVPAIAGAMVEHLLKGVRAGGSPVAEIPGYLFERRSSGENRTRGQP